MASLTIVLAKYCQPLLLRSSAVTVKPHFFQAVKSQQTAQYTYKQSVLL